MKDLLKDLLIDIFYVENFSKAEIVFYGIIVPLILIAICIAIESYPNFIK